MSCKEAPNGVPCESKVWDGDYCYVHFSLAFVCMKTGCYNHQLIEGNNTYPTCEMHTKQDRSRDSTCKYCIRYDSQMRKLATPILEHWNTPKAIPYQEEHDRIENLINECRKTH